METDTVLQELLRRATSLCKSRGYYRHAREIWQWEIRIGRIEVLVSNPDDRTTVGLQERNGHVIHWIYYVDVDNPDNSILRTELYEEALDELRRLMLLDDLADI